MNTFIQRVKASFSMEAEVTSEAAAKPFVPLVPMTFKSSSVMDLLKNYPELDWSIESCLNGTRLEKEDCVVSYKIYPMKSFEKQAKSNVRFNSQIPKEQLRVNDIKKKVLRTGKIWPIFYLGKSSLSGLPDDGNHRLGAYYELGVPGVPVMVVRKSLSRG